ncbi:MULTISPECIES: hypothetical protein [Clostridium]|uniref:hypothetical protein n=1 Tax=Clostridium TaxID=1485 RepID=UPI0008242892|nr:MULTISPECIES: hypothetical protein [Clostridium]PJI09500.1 hypothetical protein CUB90_17230 [Clostridium sp. CT7]
MEKINSVIGNGLPHVTTNTVIFVIIAIVALYIFMKVMSKIIKVVAVIAVCWFLLMSIQSTNLANIPIVKQAYNTVNKVIPSKELWQKASGYVNSAGKVVNDLKNSK